MTKETEVTAAPEPNLVSRDRPDDTEIVETVEIVDPPEERADIEEVIATQEDPRAEIYKRHTEKREEEIEEQTGGFGDQPLEIPDEDEENAQIAVESDETADIIEPTPGPTDTPPDSDPMATVKILGVPRQVPQSKIDAAGGIENYQIRIAAQEQMERNAHERAQIEARKAALDERERQMLQPAGIPATDSQESQTPDRSTPTDGQNLEAKARQYQEAVYDDAADAPSIFVQAVNEAADAAVQKALARGRPFNEAALREQVKEDVLAEQRKAKIVKAGRALIESHPELQHDDPNYDPRMYTAIDDETVVLARQHPEWEPDKVVQEAFDTISKWKGSPQPETMSDKQAQKRAMNRPRAGNKRYTPPPPPPRQTNSDYVQQERKRRGLE
jgi:hypothetical protein